MKLFILIFLMFYLISCNNKKEIIQIEENEIINFIPTSFDIEFYPEIAEGKIFISDTAKLYVKKNFLSIKENLKGFKIDYFNDQIKRAYKEVDTGRNEFYIDFRLIDINSKEIPNIFGGEANEELEYSIFKVETNKSYFLNKNERDLLKRSLFLSYKDFMAQRQREPDSAEMFSVPTKSVKQRLDKIKPARSTKSD